MSELRDILYVDDEHSNLVVFEANFEDDFRVHTASSASEALQLIDELPIPVVIADQRMPDMTGVEMFALIRRKHPHIQRVILSRVF
jgi:DNA-binding NtrC family response regulator